MAKFVELNEAASKLGLSPEALVDMRSRGEIHGYRDGASWKFKQEEIDRVAEELGAGGAAASSASDFDLDDDLGDLLSLSQEESEGDGGDDESSGSVLVSEEELGQSEDGTSSTVIGKDGEKSSPDSDIQLASESDISLESDINLESDVNLAPPSDISLGEDSVDGDNASSLSASDVQLVPEGGDTSDVRLVAGASDIQSSDDGGTGNLDLSSDLNLMDSGDNLLDSGSNIGGDLEISSDEDDSDFALSEDSLSSDDSDFALSDDALSSDEFLSSESLSSEDLVLGGGSDVTLASDSGINLNPSDSGISLEDEPIELDSSGDALELPEDEEIISLDSMSDDSSIPDFTEDQFMLGAASNESSVDESDSGSQVIALEESDQFDSSSDSQNLGAPLIAEDAVQQQLTVDPSQQLAAAGASPSTAAPMPMMQQLPETPYTIFNMMGLAIVFVLLCIAGTMMTDIIRNMWSWNQPFGMSNTFTDWVVETMGMR